MMNKLSAFFGRSGTTNGNDKLPSPGSHISQEPLDDTGLENMGSRIGAENEGLRGLLIEASRKIEELDLLKITFGNIVAPVSDMLRELEQEKSQNASLRNLLADVRSHLDSLRAEHAATEKDRAALKRDNATLQQDVAGYRDDIQALETAQNELSAQITSYRAQIAQFERQLHNETTQHNALADAHRLLGDQMQASDKKNVRLEADIHSLQEKLLLTDEEKQSVQKSLDQSIAELSRVARRLSETESLLASSRNKISELEAAINEGESARNALQLRLDEANEQHQTEAAALTNRLGSLQSRASASEKMLTELRQNLLARTEEARDWERKTAESESARIASEKKLRQAETATEALEQQIAELTQSRATLVERSAAVNKTLKLREAALARADEKNAALSERLKQLENDMQALRDSDEKRLEELNSALSRERMARAVAEGALASSRRDFARVQQEITTINTDKVMNTGAPAQTPAALAKRVKTNFSKTATASAEPAAAAPKGRNGKKPTVEDQDQPLKN